DERERSLGIIPQPGVVERGFSLKRMLEQNLVPACTAVYRAELFNCMPSWLPKVKYGDYVFNIMAASSGKIHFVDKIIAVYRRHSGSMTGRETHEENICELVKIYILILQHRSLAPDGLRHTEASLVRNASLLIQNFVDNNRIREAGKLFFEVNSVLEVAGLGDREKSFSQKFGPYLSSFQRSNPYISVVLTTYNRPKLLIDALNSLARQTFKHFEVLLINDGGAPVEHY